jgi:3-deoxy-7-phosphoheptulonate synthase
MAAGDVATRLMIDASHGNSGKRPERQPAVVADIASQVDAGDQRIGGVMIESNLVAGRQELVPGRALVYGQSVTDGCIDWPTSVEVLEQLAAAVARGRTSRAPLECRAGI